MRVRERAAPLAAVQSHRPHSHRPRPHRKLARTQARGRFGGGEGGGGCAEHFSAGRRRSGRRPTRAPRRRPTREPRRRPTRESASRAPGKFPGGRRKAGGACGLFSVCFVLFAVVSLVLLFLWWRWGGGGEKGGKGCSLFCVDISSRKAFRSERELFHEFLGSLEDTRKV